MGTRGLGSAAAGVEGAPVGDTLLAGRVLTCLKGGPVGVLGGSGGGCCGGGRGGGGVPDIEEALGDDG